MCLSLVWNNNLILENSLQINFSGLGLFYKDISAAYYTLKVLMMVKEEEIYSRLRSKLDIGEPDNLEPF